MMPASKKECSTSGNKYKKLSLLIDSYFSQLSAEQTLRDKDKMVSLVKDDFLIINCIIKTLKLKNAFHALNGPIILTRLLQQISSICDSFLNSINSKNFSNKQKLLQYFEELLKSTLRSVSCFIFGGFSRGTLLLLFGICVKHIQSNTFPECRDTFFKICLKVFIFDKPQRRDYLHRVISLILENKCLKSFYITNSNSKNCSVSPLTALFFFLLQSVCVVDKKRSDIKNKSIKTAPKFLFTRLQELTSLLEDALSAVFSFVFAAVNDFPKNFQKQTFASFWSDVLSCIFLPEFPVSETVIVYLLTFIVAFLEDEQNRDVSVTVKSIFISAIESYFVALHKLSSLLRQYLETSSEDSRIGRVERLINFYWPKVTQSTEKFYFLLARQFLVINSGKCCFKGNKRIHVHLKNRFLEKHLNPNKRHSLSLTDEKMTRKQFICTFFKNWDSKKILEDLINVNFVLKALLLEKNGSIRFQAMKVFSSYITLYPSVLTRKNVFSVLVERCRDKSAIIREISIDTIGTVLREGLQSEDDCCNVICARSIDSSINVRKKVIDIATGYLKKEGVKPHIFTNFFLSILNRIDDREQTVSTRAFVKLENILFFIPEKIILPKLIEILVGYGKEKQLRKVFDRAFSDKKSKKRIDCESKKHKKLGEFCGLIISAVAKGDFLFSEKLDQSSTLSGQHIKLQRTVPYLKLLKILVTFNKTIFFANYGIFSALLNVDSSNLSELAVGANVDSHVLSLVFSSLANLDEGEISEFKKELDLIKDDIVVAVRTKASEVVKKAVPCLRLLVNKFFVGERDVNQLLSQSRHALKLFCGFKRKLGDHVDSSKNSVARAVLVVGLLEKYFEVENEPKTTFLLLQNCFKKTNDEDIKYVTVQAIFDIFYGMINNRQHLEFNEFCENTLIDDRGASSKQTLSVLEGVLALLKTQEKIRKFKQKPRNDSNSFQCISKPEHLLAVFISEAASNFLSHFCQRNTHVFLEKAKGDFQEFRVVSFEILARIVSNNIFCPSKIVPSLMSGAIDPNDKIRQRSVSVINDLSERRTDLLKGKFLEGLLLSIKQSLTQFHLKTSTLVSRLQSLTFSFQKTFARFTSKRVFSRQVVTYLESLLCDNANEAYFDELCILSEMINHFLDNKSKGMLLQEILNCLRLKGDIVFLADGDELKLLAEKSAAEIESSLKEVVLVCLKTLFAKSLLKGIKGGEGHYRPFQKSESVLSKWVGSVNYSSKGVMVEHFEKLMTFIDAEIKTFFMGMDELDNLVGSK